jgi:D-alanyl-D-alanine carboxypeptidase
VAIGLAPLCAAALPPPAAHAEATILVEADTGKVLEAENATYPWYPASVTKLMTAYVTLSAIKAGRITLDSLFTVSHAAAAQSPTKMGFPPGTQVTVDNALKMLLVHSANDMAVLLAEGTDGSIDSFSEEMTRTAHRLGMTQSNFVNPNGLPADGQITSARDLAILARALIHEFPEYGAYWHIAAIKFGRRVIHNTNSLVGRYPGLDGMKTGFICASGFNVVATATRGGRRLIAVVLGAPSSQARSIKAAELLERGFTQNPLGWLTPSLGSVEGLTPVNADPPNLHDTVCGPHRKRPAAEEEEEAGTENGVGGVDTPFSTLLSSLRTPTPKGAALLSDYESTPPVVVYTGPTRTPAEVAKLAAIEPGPAHKKKAAAKTAAAKATDDKAADDKAPDGKATEHGHKAKPAAKSAAAVEKPKKHKAEPAAKPAAGAQ